MNIQNKVCICTGELSSSQELSVLLEKHAAQTYIFPMIEIENVVVSPPDLQYFSNISEFNWLLFTSKNGVHSFFEQYKNLFSNYILPAHISIASVGAKTTKVLLNYVQKVNFTCSKNNGKDFAQEFSEYIGNSSVSMLFPTGNLTQNMIQLNVPKEVSITKIITYNTNPPQAFDDLILNKIKNAEYDFLIFTSPSGFTNFYELFSQRLNIQSIKAISIGPATTKRLASYNVTPFLQASTHTNEGIVDAMLSF